MESDVEYQSLTYELEVKGQHRGRTVLTVCAMSTIQEEFVALLNKLGEGEEVDAPLARGWYLRLGRLNGELWFQHFNQKSSDGPLLFYMCTSKGRPYGAGIIIEEPSLRVRCSDAGITNLGEGDHLVGLVVKGDDGKAKLRASFSNLHTNGTHIRFSSAGEVFLDEQSIGFIRATVLSNKNRLDGRVALIGSEPLPEGVEMPHLELEDLALNAL